MTDKVVKGTDLFYFSSFTTLAVMISVIVINFILAKIETLDLNYCQDPSNAEEFHILHNSSSCPPELDNRVSGDSQIGHLCSLSANLLISLVVPLVSTSIISKIWQIKTYVFLMIQVILFNSQSIVSSTTGSTLISLGSRINKIYDIWLAFISLIILILLFNLVYKYRHIVKNNSEEMEFVFKIDQVIEIWADEKSDSSLNLEHLKSEMSEQYYGDLRFSAHPLVKKLSKQERDSLRPQHISVDSKVFPFNYRNLESIKENQRLKQYNIFLLFVLVIIQWVIELVYFIQVASVSDKIDVTSSLLIRTGLFWNSLLIYTVLFSSMLFLYMSSTFRFLRHGLKPSIASFHSPTTEELSVLNEKLVVDETIFIDINDIIIKIRKGMDRVRLKRIIKIDEEKEE